MGDAAPAVFESLSVRVEGAIGELRLDRPEKLNPLSIEMLEEIARAARYFDEARGVKVVVVRGSGASFSSGADLASFGRVEGRTTREVAELGRAMADSLEAMRAISIAAIRGWCVGGGMVLASACDLRIASESARFRVPEVDLGIPLAWGGIPRLVREIGPALTKELVMTCRRFTPQEAQAAGFVNRVVPEARLAAEARALAEELARKPAVPVIITKEHVNAVTRAMSAGHTSFADGDVLLGSVFDPDSLEAARRYRDLTFGKGGKGR